MQGTALPQPAVNYARLFGPPATAYSISGAQGPIDTLPLWYINEHMTFSTLRHGTIMVELITSLFSVCMMLFCCGNQPSVNYSFRRGTPDNNPGIFLRSTGASVRLA